jgi:hypothetical protein
VKLPGSGHYIKIDLHTPSFEEQVIFFSFGFSRLKKKLLIIRIFVDRHLQKFF